MSHHLARSHYSPEGLEARTLAALGRAGISADGAPVDVEALAPLDQFHAGGLAATIDLIEMLDPAPDTRVLDIGSGLGGPARVLASRRGCRVTGVDLMPDYVAIADRLSELCGLTDATTFIQGDALALGLSGPAFHHAWALHVAMNIRDSRSFYRGAHDAIMSGGRFLSYDVVESEFPRVDFPVPWASSAELSHLRTREQTTEALAEAGFVNIRAIDRTHEASAALARATSGSPSLPPSLSLGVLLGPRTVEMVANFAHALRTGGVRIIVFIATKPAQ
ncbi:MAG: class I SAM-dependent methyltransferase [Planctomycetota bacterium]|nr:class I SAM-dependent methyltransferase [Planctomycetota bacterium]